MKKFVQALYAYRKADSSDEEPEEEICSSVEDGNINEKLIKK